MARMIYDFSFWFDLFDVPSLVYSSICSTPCARLLMLLVFSKPLQSGVCSMQKCNVDANPFSAIRSSWWSMLDMVWSCSKHTLMEVALCRRMPSIVGAAGVSFRVRASDNVLVKTTHNAKIISKIPRSRRAACNLLPFLFPQFILVLFRQLDQVVSCPESLLNDRSPTCRRQEVAVEAPENNFGPPNHLRE